MNYFTVSDGVFYPQFRNNFSESNKIPLLIIPLQIAISNHISKLIAYSC